MYKIHDLFAKKNCERIKISKIAKLACGTSIDRDDDCFVCTVIEV
jgi:hypothetical protein